MARKRKTNFKWIKAVITLFVICSIYKIIKALNIYTIACIFLVLILSLAIYFMLEQNDNAHDVYKKPNFLQFGTYQPKKFNALKLEELRKMNPYQFEEYIAWVYRCLGYSDAYATQQSGDGGKDVIFSEIDAETGRKKYFYSECKRYYRGKVPRPAIQKLVGAALADNAIPYAVVTTGRFTKEALIEAKKTGVRCIGPQGLLEMIERAEKLENTKESELVESAL